MAADDIALSAAIHFLEKYEKIHKSEWEVVSRDEKMYLKKTIEMLKKKRRKQVCNTDITGLPTNGLFPAPAYDKYYAVAEKGDTNYVQKTCKSFDGSSSGQSK